MRAVLRRHLPRLQQLQRLQGGDQRLRHHLLLLLRFLLQVLVPASALQMQGDLLHQMPIHRHHRHLLQPVGRLQRVCPQWLPPEDLLDPFRQND